MHDYKEIIHAIKEYIAPGSLGLFSGALAYFYKVTQGEKFKMWMFIFNALLAFWVAKVVGSFISPDLAYRDGIIGFFSFFSYPIVKWGEKYIPEIMRKIIEKRFNINLDE